jgi:hypothetical protein
MRLTTLLMALLCCAAVASAQTPAQPAPDGETGIVWRDRPTIDFGNGSRIDLRARVQHQSVLRDDGADAAGAGTPSDRFSFPRSRFGVTGELVGRVEFQVEHDMAGTGVWRDVYADYRVSRRLRVRAGQFKAPFSREQLTSAFDLAFVARAAAVNDLVPLREVGVMAHGELASRAVRYETGFFDGVRTFTGRVTLAALADGARRGSDGLEIAAAFRRSPLDEGRTGFEGTLVMGERFFDRIFANGSRSMVGVSAVWHVPQVTLAGELVRAADTRLGQAIDEGDLPDLLATGGYASAVWHVIHGKGRRRGRAPFRELDITGRLDWLHFGSASSGEPPFSNPRAGHVAPLGKRAVTMGVTWHLNRWLRVQSNAVRERLIDSLGVYSVTAAPVWSAVVRSQVVM